MKKILSIALIAALVATSAFAAFSGSAAIKAGVDLDSKNYGFINSDSETLIFTFEFASGEVSASGEGDLRAEIAADFSVGFDYDTTADDLVTDASVIEITKANIIYKDVTVGILNAGKSATYAADYHLDDDGDPITNYVKALSGVPGFTVSAFGYIGGFGFNGDADAETYAVLAHAQTKSFDLAEGVTAQAAAGMKVTESASIFGVSAKTAFVKDAISADAAVDFGFGEKVAVDFVANTAYDFVSANVYYGTEDGFESNKLDAMVAAEKAVNENITVGGSVDFTDIIVDAREIAISADGTFAFAPVTLGASASYSVFAKDLEVSADVTYGADLFTAKAGVVFGTTIDTEDSSYVYATASISSDKVVDGTTISLAYAPAKDSGVVVTNYLKDGTKLGTIYASATIAF